MHTECRESVPARYDRLLGSRMLVGNIELRFPLLRPFGVSQNMYGPLPIEVALFADGGVAYQSRREPDVPGRKPAERVEPWRDAAGKSLRIRDRPIPLRAAASTDWQRVGI